MKLSKKIALITFLGIFVSVIWSNFIVLPLIKLILDQIQTQNLLIYLGKTIFLIIALPLLSVVPVWLLLWFYLRGAVVKPLSYFNQVAKIIASGNLGTRLKLLPTGEIGELGKNINLIIDHLAGAFQNMAFSLGKEKVKEKELADSLAQDEALLSSISDAVIAIDKSGDIILFNKAAALLTGVSSDQAIKTSYKKVLNIVPEKEDAEVFDFVEKAFLGNLEKSSQHLAIKAFDGRKTPISYSVGPIFDRKKQVSGVILVLRNITSEREFDKTKDEFLSIASHELRTPMSAIKNLLSMIFEGDYGQVNNELREPLQDIASSTQRLIQLVNDMLDVSRLQAGRIKIELEEVRIDHLIEEAVKLLKVLTIEKNIYLEIASLIPQTLRTDLNKIKEVLQNLIGNAIKFTDRGGIKIFCRKDARFFYVSVADSGIGISKEDQPKLFSKFAQISTGEYIRPPGTGLGLYISREYIRKLGGDLWIENSQEGYGSIFTFSLPILFSSPQVAKI